MHKRALIVLLFFTFSCSPFIIGPALKDGQTLQLEVAKYYDGVADTSYSYDVSIRKDQEQYKLFFTKGSQTETYQLPANKLSLLGEMETAFTDLKSHTGYIYYYVIVQTGKTKKTYKINTDLIHDFITGLKK